LALLWGDGLLRIYRQQEQVADKGNGMGV
jgi:hypothetical protein